MNFICKIHRVMCGSTRFNDKPGQPVKLRFKRSDRLTHRPTHPTGSIPGSVLLTLLLTCHGVLIQFNPTIHPFNDLFYYT